MSGDTGQSRRTVLGSIAAAFAGGQTAAKAVAAEVSNVAAAASLGQGLNTIEAANRMPGYMNDPLFAHLRKVRRYQEALHGYESKVIIPSIDAIKSYSPWYRAHKTALFRAEPETHDVIDQVITEIGRRIGL